MFASTSPTWRPERFVGVPATSFVSEVSPLGMPSLPTCPGTGLDVTDAPIQAQYQGKRHNLVGVTSS